MDLNQENFDGPVGEAVGLIDRLQEYTLEFFAKDYQFIMQGLLEPDMRNNILSCYDEQHRPSVNEWNSIIMNGINVG